MTDTPPTFPLHWQRRLSAALGLLVLMIGVLQILSGYRMMPPTRGLLLAPDAAIVLCLSAIALVLVNGRRRPTTRVGQGVAGAVIGLALAAMAEATIGIDVGWDRLFLLPTHVPMSATTALNFLFLGVALWQCGRWHGNDWSVVGILTLDVAGTAIVALLIILSQAVQANPGPVYAPMGLDMAGVFIGLAVAVGLARPEATPPGSPGGGLMGRLRLTILVAVASTSLWCLGGSRQGIYGTEISLAVTGIATMVVTLLLTWRTAARIDAIEARRQEALERAEASDRAKTAFLSNMSHELRTPLNAIIGFSELLEQGVCGPLAPRQLRSVQQVHMGSLHLLRLVNEILDIAKVQAVGLTLATERVTVASLVEEVSAFLHPLAMTRGLTLEVACETAGTVQADPVRLRQVLTNLVANAIKFTRPGGWVRLRCWEADGTLQVAVADTGIGIHADDLSKLFKPFSQLADTAAPSHEGTGLGLYLCKRLIDLHGGTISVNSTPDVGTTVTVALPMVIAEAPQQAGRSVRPSARTVCSPMRRPIEKRPAAFPQTTVGRAA
jgi:signal transduction histidine kinase